MDPSKPNVVLVISDDTPFRSIGYKEGRVLTPAIDAIRSQGIDFANFTATSSVCTPSRFSCLTGLYAGNCPAPGFLSGVPENEPYCVTWNTDITPDIPTLGSVFQSGGYRTGYVGKWHNGVAPSRFPGHPYNPTDDPADPGVAARLKLDYAVLVSHIRSCGFDYADGVNYANTDNRTIRSMQVHNHEWMTKKAIEFLDSTKKEEPFFLHVATTAIHGPSHIDALAGDLRVVEYGYTEEDLTGVLPPRHTVAERLDHAGIEITHQSVGALQLDDVVGALRKKLEAMGLLENTIFLYLTDHGWDSAKGTCCEAGLRVPATMSWPARIGGGKTCGAVVRHIDLLPTFAEVCSLPIPENGKWDGKSRAKQIFDGEADGISEVYAEMGYIRSLRKGKWKYIAYRYPESLIRKMEAGELPMAPNLLGHLGGAQYRQISRYRCYWQQDRLHDLDTDPGEQINLAAEEPEILEEMKERLSVHLSGFPRPFDLSPQPYLDSPEFSELAKKTTNTNDLITHEYYLKGAF